MSRQPMSLLGSQSGMLKNVGGIKLHLCGATFILAKQ